MRAWDTEMYSMPRMYVCGSSGGDGHMRVACENGGTHTPSPYMVSPPCISAVLVLNKSIAFGTPCNCMYVYRVTDANNKCTVDMQL